MRRATSHFAARGAVAAVVAVAAVGAVIALWARDDVLDGDGFVEATAPVVARDDVRDAVAELTIEALGAQPPPVQQQIRTGARELAASQRFAELWRAANAAAHAQARALVQGDGRRVTLDVGGLADLVVERLRAAGVPVDAGDVDRARTSVVVLDAREAGTARDVASWAERLALLLPGIAGGGLVALLLLPGRLSAATALAAIAAALLLAAAIALGDTVERVGEQAPQGPRGVIERAYTDAVVQPLRTDLRRGTWLALAVACGAGAAALPRQRPRR